MVLTSEAGQVCFDSNIRRGYSNKNLRLVSGVVNLLQLGVAHQIIVVSATAFGTDLFSVNRLRKVSKGSSFFARFLNIDMRVPRTESNFAAGRRCRCQIIAHIMAWALPRSSSCPAGFR